MNSLIPRRYRVRWRRRENHDTVTLVLEPVDEPIAAFGPGQFTMLYAYGVGEAPISVSGDPTAASELLVHTVRAVGPVTCALCASRARESVWVRGPYGRGWGEVPAAVDLVLVAGGIGLAPLRPALLAALSQPDRSGQIVLLAGARSPAELLFTRQLSAWARRPGVDVALTVDRAAPDWSGRVGLVSELVETADFDPGTALALVCGPEAMMRFTARALQRRGVPAGRIRVSLERTMRCGVGLCGHCQVGPVLVCRDGPVVSYADVASLLTIREL